jgi:alpha-galactosidase
MTQSSVYQLLADGVSLIIDTSTGTPVIAHWGKDVALEKLDDQVQAILSESIPYASIDQPQNPGVWRENSRGFLGRPALSGHRTGQDWSPFFKLKSSERTETNLSFVSEDSLAGLQVKVSYQMLPSGVVLISQSVSNVGTSDYFLEELLTWLPLPDQATQTLDFTGRWVLERQPQRRQIQSGTWSREVREGRTGHDYTIVQLALTEGANYQHGEVWSTGLMWSGNSRHLVEKLPSGRSTIAAGELLLPGEMILKPGQSYEAPTVVATYSYSGIDQVSDRIYRWLRARPNHPTNIRARPITLNVWEAVYFNHNLEKLIQLADVAKEVGVERMVLDDGWFGSRRDDSKGLGDWVVSKEVWPEGLKPLIDRVKSNGMEFGLWFEGEMVNADSDLYRAHPEWILRSGDRIPPEARHQQVLDLTHPGAFDHVFNQIDAILSNNDISYIKWDHNRVLTEPSHLGQAAVHNQTLAIYRMFDELKKKHPGLEIESCSSGGGRIDLGMAQHVDRFWTSDSNDALERQYIQRYSQIAIPPEMLGSHIGPTLGHITGRTHKLSFRAITALFGHAGIEWDLTETNELERAQLKSWTDYYKKNRALIHSGKIVRVDQPDDSTFVHGVVAQDKSKALFAYVQLRPAGGTLPGALRFEGLDPLVSYKVIAEQPCGPAMFMSQKSPSWLEGATLTGAALSTIGLRPPILAPENAILISLEKL